MSNAQEDTDLQKDIFIKNSESNGEYGNGKQHFFYIRQSVIEELLKCSLFHCGCSSLLPKATVSCRGWDVLSTQWSPEGSPRPSWPS